MLAAPNLAGLPVVEIDRNPGPVGLLPYHSNPSSVLNPLTQQPRLEFNEQTSSHSSPGTARSLWSHGVASISDKLDQPPHEYRMYCSSPLPPSPKTLFTAETLLQPHSQASPAHGDTVDHDAASRGTPEGSMYQPSSPISIADSTLPWTASDADQSGSACNSLLTERLSPCSVASSINDHLEGPSENPEMLARLEHTSTGVDLRVAWKAFVDGVCLVPFDLTPASYEHFKWLTVTPEHAGADFRALGFEAALCGLTVQGPPGSENVNATETPVIDPYLQQTKEPDTNFTRYLRTLNDNTEEKDGFCIAPLDELDVPPLLGLSEGLGFMHKYEQGISVNDGALVDAVMPNIPRVPRSLDSPYEDLSGQDHFQAQTRLLPSPEPLESRLCTLGRSNQHTQSFTSIAPQDSGSVDDEPDWKSPQINNTVLLGRCTQRDVSEHDHFAVGTGANGTLLSSIYSTDTTSLDTLKPTRCGVPTQNEVHGNTPQVVITPRHPPSPEIMTSVYSHVSEGGANEFGGGTHPVCDTVVSIGSGQILGPDLFGGDENEHGEDDNLGLSRVLSCTKSGTSDAE